jgi:inositol-phosphate phosphatase/L-galactose 1-phosphate phosphatase/histidinol-phosphatase
VSDLAPFLTLADELADLAGDVLRRYFRAPLSVETKADQSPVTIADRESEARMREMIGRRAPGHGILGEEYGTENAGAEWVWVLDPVDGTKAFITGKPSFGVLIALLHQGRPVLGILDQPILRERWRGAAGQPTTLNGQPARARDCPDLSKAYAYATAPEMFAGADETAWNRLRPKTRMVRYGADCYAYGLLASGHVDLVVEASLQPYDYLPLVAIIEGAGGIVTDWRGRRPDLDSDGRIVAAGDKRTHGEALTVLA